MKSFSKQELAVTITIFLVVFAIVGYNLNLSLRRARDATRRQDLSTISEVLEKYHADFGFFPPAENGKIKACKGENFEAIVEDIKDDPVLDKQKLFEGFKVCEWGQDGVMDLFDASYPPYIKTLPKDPRANEGREYVYFASNDRYQIYSMLEGGDTEVGYDNTIVERNLQCGNQICSFGKSYATTPLDISIEEYEQELVRLKRLEMGR